MDIRREVYSCIILNHGYAKIGMELLCTWTAGCLRIKVIL
jgi:hypothetical protein